MDLQKYKSLRRMYPRLRLSWSLYFKWMRGDWLGVYQYLANVEPAPTFAMVRGRRVHEILERLPTERYIQDILGVPVSKFSKEGKVEIVSNDFVLPVTLVGVIDLLVEVGTGQQIVVDFKTGKTPLRSYKDQLIFYSLLKPGAVAGLLVKFDQNFEMSDIFLVKVGEKEREEVMAKLDQFVVEFAMRLQDGEFDRFLEENKVPGFKISR